MRGFSPLAVKRAGILAVFFGLLLRFAIPAGYMLAPDGALAIVPCPASGAVLTMAGPSTEPGDHAMQAMHAHYHGGKHSAPAGDSPEHRADGCPFGALSAPAALPESPLNLVAIAPLDVALRTPGRPPTRTVPPAASTPPVRGPPFLS